MKRQTLLLLIGHFAAGLVLLFVDYYGRGLAFRRDVIVSSILRAAFILMFVPLTAAVARPLIRELRFTRILATIAVIIVSAFAAEATYFIGINRYAQLIGSRQRFDVIPAALMSLTYPTLILMSATMMLTWMRSAEATHLRSMRLIDSERQLTEARLRLLHSQLQPHFLFNSLNSLSALVRRDPEGARRMLQKLEGFYLASARAGGRRSFTLEEELRHVRDYIDIESIRFGSRLRTKIDVSSDALDAELPPFLLQPLVENAIRHGVGSTPGSGSLSIIAEKIGSEIVVTIENNPSSSPRVSHGLGLHNCRERMGHTWERGAQLETSFDSNRARVRLTFPARIDRS